jgi:hypothetical protein
MPQQVRQCIGCGFNPRYRKPPANPWEAMEEQGLADIEMVKLGDASIAAPFTSKACMREGLVDDGACPWFRRCSPDFGLRFKDMHACVQRGLGLRGCSLAGVYGCLPCGSNSKGMPRCGNGVVQGVIGHVPTYSSTHSFADAIDPVHGGHHPPGPRNVALDPPDVPDPGPQLPHLVILLVRCVRR